MYPREVGMNICEGIAAQRKLDSVGLAWRPLMSVDQMQTAAKNTNAGVCTSESLHEEGGHGITAWDDISGQQLVPTIHGGRQEGRDKVLPRNWRL